MSKEWNGEPCLCGCEDVGNKWECEVEGCEEVGVLGIFDSPACHRHHFDRLVEAGVIHEGLRKVRT